jgi:hypothetical protein
LRNETPFISVILCIKTFFSSIVVMNKLPISYKYINILCQSSVPHGGLLATSVGFCANCDRIPFKYCISSYFSVAQISPL